MFYLVGLVCNDTGSNDDRANVHVAIIDQPRLLMGVRVAAVGKGGYSAKLWRSLRPQTAV